MSEPRGCKVIATYLGDRRGRPLTASETLQLLQFSMDREQRVNPGLPMDTVLVLNQFDPKHDPCTDPEGVAAAHRYLEQLDGQTTPWGQIRVLRRANIGLSFGAYNYAFQALGPQYPYWMFTEDDRVLVRDDYFAKHVDQLRGSVGFVGTTRVSRVKGRGSYAHGAMGVSSLEILNSVCKQHVSYKYPRGRLPYYDGPRRPRSKTETEIRHADYEDHELAGEVQMSAAIQRMGFQVVELNWSRVFCTWGRGSPKSKPEASFPEQLQLYTGETP